MDRQAGHHTERLPHRLSNLYWAFRNFENRKRRKTKFAASQDEEDSKEIVTPVNSSTKTKNRCSLCIKKYKEQGRRSGNGKEKRNSGTTAVKFPDKNFVTSTDPDGMSEHLRFLTYKLMKNTTKNSCKHTADGARFSVHGNVPVKSSTCISCSDSQGVRDLYPLRGSLFSNVPPYLFFSSDAEKMAKLPKEIRRTLRWKMSPITPSIVIDIVSSTGFSMTKNESKWLSTWGRHVKSHKFTDFQENQKINHLPGSFQMGRKDKLWQNISKMQKRHGKEEFAIMPHTYILPGSVEKLRREWFEKESVTKWIVKPPASARGTGVAVTNRWKDVPKDQPVIVQKYISNPYLINDTKFDLRLYVLVTSVDPLRIYVFEDGLVRFASEKYSTSVNSLKEKFIHLTNYSINRSNSRYAANQDESVPQGHKWSLKCLWSHFRDAGKDDKEIWCSLLDVIIKTIISCENPISKMVKTYSKNRYCCYELFGFDIMLDRNLKPWILEVNISPSLQTKSQLDLKIKSELVADMFNTVGFHIPDGINLSSKSRLQISERAGIHPLTEICWNKQLHQLNTSPEGRMKKSDFEKGKLDEASLLKYLTADDVKQLVQSEDELARCGRLVRVFPSRTSCLYLKYFKYPKYYNYLLNAWEIKYQNKRKMGILLLQTFCLQKIHLQPTQIDDVCGVIPIKSSIQSSTDFDGKHGLSSTRSCLTVSVKKAQCDST